MAHFARLDENNIVIQVIVVTNGAVDNLPFPESEPIGVEFCQSIFGPDTVWKQTSYNSNFRKHYAAVGMIYDAGIDAFIVPQPYLSWTLNPDTGNWDAPVPYPTDGRDYEWNEQAQVWEVIFRYQQLGFPPPDQLAP